MSNREDWLMQRVSELEAERDKLAEMLDRQSAFVVACNGAIHDLHRELEKMNQVTSRPGSLPTHEDVIEIDEDGVVRAIGPKPARYLKANDTPR